MKFNNLMNQKKYTISVRGSVAGVGVSTAALAVSSDSLVAATSASFFAWGERGEGCGGGSRAGCAEERSMRVEILL